MINNKRSKFRSEKRQI